MTNSKIGSTYEDLAAKILNKHGYWAHIIQKSVHGQPVDIVAAKKLNGTDIVYLLDVKHVETDKISFVLNRIEPNQLSSLRFANEFAKLDRLGFAIYFERTNMWYWLPYKQAYTLYKNSIKSINLKLLEKFEDILE
jgi:Holliday junction resolvase-like predicted endonuclease